MDLRAHARYSLERSRGLTEQVLSSFATPNDWFYQAHPKANFALWIVGHLGLVDNMIISRHQPAKVSKADGWDSLFWFGSQLHADRTVYPQAEDALAYFRERRQTLLKVLEETTDEQLNAPAPTERSPIAGAPNAGHLFLFAAQHEGIHFGQLTVAHRGLGHPPIFTP